MKTIITTVQDCLENHFGIKVKRQLMKWPHGVGSIAQLVDYSLQSMGIYNQKIHVLSELNKNIACSIKKAEKILGYKPEVALEEGMKRSIEWCIKKGYLKTG